MARGRPASPKPRGEGGSERGLTRLSRQRTQTARRCLDKVHRFKDSHSRLCMIAVTRRRTKILATLGPASDGALKMEELLRAGVDLFRVNFSHGSHAEHAGRIAAAREAE